MILNLLQKLLEKYLLIHNSMFLDDYRFLVPLYPYEIYIIINTYI